MSRNVALACSAIVFFVSVWQAAGLQAQSPVADSGTTTVVVVSGTVTDVHGKPVAHATVSVKSAKSGESVTAESDTAGKYLLTGLSLGDYDVTVSADGYAAKTVHISVVGQQEGTLDLALVAGGQPQAPPASTPLPNAPTSPSAPSLSDLGFSTQQTQGDAKLQALLKRRTEMLRVHQRLGLITLAPMAATLITGPMAKTEDENGRTIKQPTDANLDFHFALGAATGALYATTAYYAIRAPRVPGTHKHGAIRVHEVLAFVHGPGMIATGVLGYMAYKQESSGEKVHGIASQHGTVAWATTIAYGASIVAVSWPIHLKFWEKKQ